MDRRQEATAGEGRDGGPRNVLVGPAVNNAFAVPGPAVVDPPVVKGACNLETNADESPPVVEVAATRRCLKIA